METQSSPKEPDQNLLDPLKQLVSRAQAGDTAVLPELQKYFDDTPSVWQTVGNLAVHAEQSLIMQAAGKNLLLRESLLRKVAELKGELGLVGATPLERLVIERIAICWLELHHSELMMSQAKSISLQEAAYCQKRLDHCQRRYLAAIRSLALVRRLLPQTRRSG